MKQYRSLVKTMESETIKKNEANPKSQRSRNNQLRKIYYTLCAVSLFSLAGCEFFSNIEFVKGSILDIDYSLSIGDALDNYKYFTSTEWKEFETSQGREVVEFKGYYFKNDVIIRIQFRINKDWQEDDEGASFRVGYQCYAYTSERGEKKEVKDSDLISLLYKNKEIRYLSHKDLRKK
jgi:hypothetical protein